tara:strand:+ start:1955 stop:2665 length:711 start_codon:yes stop_codon:yes gene_type:complete
MKNIKAYNDFINEGRSRYDGIASKIVKKNFRKWITDWKAGKKSSTYIDQIELDDLEFDFTSTLYFDKVEGTKIKGFEIVGSTGADGRDFYIDDEGDEVYQTPFIIIDFAIESDWLPGFWQEIYMYLADCTRHEMEHITQDGKDTGNYRPGKPDEDDSFMRSLIKSGMMPEYHYLLLPKEVDANLQGLRYEAKKRKVSMEVTVNNYLDTKGYSEEERSEILDTWRKRAKQIGGIPKF